MKNCLPYRNWRIYFNDLTREYQAKRWVTSARETLLTAPNRADIERRIDTFENGAALRAECGRA